MSSFWEQALETALAVGIAVPATLFTLLVFHRLLSPRVVFSEYIRNIYVSRLGRQSYSIKMKKSGFVDLIDTRVVCRLAIRNVRGDGSNIWNHYVVPTTFSNSLRLSSATRIVHLNLHRMKKLKDNKSLLVLNSRPARASVGYRFEDFFIQFDRAYVQVELLGHDAFTGVKKLYRSPMYRIWSIRAGNWDGMRLIINYGSKHA